MTKQRLARCLATLTALFFFLSHSSAQRIPLDSLDQHGIQFALDSTTDSFFLSGAGARHGTSETWLDFSVDMEMAKLLPTLSSTHAFFSLHANGNWNSGLGGAIQTISGIQSRAGARMAELWLEQSVAPGIRVRLGQMDASRDLASIENGAAFVNTASGYTPSFSALPNYNTTRPGAELHVQGRNMRLNVATFIKNLGGGLLLIEEGEAHWRRNSYPGRLALGAWQSPGQTATVDGGMQHGAGGEYVVVEQTFWRNAAGKESLSAYFQLGSAAAQFSPFVRHAGGGLVWNAPFHSRTSDAVGFSLSRGHLSRTATSTSSAEETIWETFYRVQMSARMSLSPDLQCIRHPGGNTRTLVAFGLRLNVSLLPHRK